MITGEPLFLEQDMTAKKPVPGQQRQALYVAKLEKQDLRQIAIWVPAAKLARLEKHIERLKKRGEKTSLSRLISERL